jgi:uncharacterized delta-60 repeat protein
MRQILVAAAAALLLVAGHATAQTIDPYDPEPEGPPTTLAIDAAGRVLIGGSFGEVGGTVRRSMARLDADGSVDATFADPDIDNVVDAIAVQPDGKILIGGSFTHVGGEARHYLARLDADGSLDAGFADPNLDAAVWAIAVQPDGKVLAGGDFGHAGAATRSYFARFAANGVLDASFPDPGICCLPVRAVALQSDGHVLIGGYFSHVGADTHFNLARFSASGAFDPSFPDVPGSVPIVALAMLVAPDDSVYVNGTSAEPVVKLHGDGTYDASFVAAPTDAGIDGMTLQPDGKVLIGASSRPPADSRAMRSPASRRMARSTRRSAIRASASPPAIRTVTSTASPPRPTDASSRSATSRSPTARRAGTWRASRPAITSSTSSSSKATATA